MEWEKLRGSLRKLIKYAKEEYIPYFNFISSAPGRADFLNTHQDYKGLPVVPVAIKLRAYMLPVSWSTTFQVISLNLKEMGLEYVDEFEVKDIEYQRGRWFGNYFRAVAKVFFEKTKIVPSKCLKVILYSEVPIGAGLGSSATIEVAFAKLLAHTYKVNLSPKDLAEICYIAEHDELGIPCGRLDQYGSSFGGIIKLETKPPYTVEKLPHKGLIFVVVDSGIKHSTAAIHPVRQKEIDLGLSELLSLDLPVDLKKKLAPKYYEVSWEEISEDEIYPYINKINETSAKRILFTLKMNSLTEMAISLLKGEVKCRDLEELLGVPEEVRTLRGWRKRKLILGEIMNKQHELLRDLYEVSTPELEEIREAMLKAGAYGVKISGAGLGGALIALVDLELANKVLEEGIKAGARRGWISRTCPGATIETI